MDFYDLFDICYGQHEYSSKTDLIVSENGTPLISSKGTNYGVYGYYDIEPKYNHVISVPRTGSICMAFYQKNDCCVDDNCLVMIPKKTLSIQEMIYFSLLVRNERFRYLYGRQVTPDRLGLTIIPTMPKYVKSTIIKNPISNKPQYKQKDTLTEIEKWKYVKINDIFTVKGTKTIPKDDLDYTTELYPYVTTQATNNGTAEFSNSKSEVGNVLTIDSAVVGSCFYQPQEFSASDHVEKLIPRFELNVYIAIFLIAVINKEQYRYSYGRKFNQIRIRETKIKLPFKNNKPDWKFMEDYVKSLPYSSNLE